MKIRPFALSSLSLSLSLGAATAVSSLAGAAAPVPPSLVDDSDSAEGATSSSSSIMEASLSSARPPADSTDRRGERSRSLQEERPRYGYDRYYPPYARAVRPAGKSGADAAEGESSSLLLFSDTDLADRSVRWGRCVAVNVTAVNPPADADADADADASCGPCLECRRVARRREGCSVCQDEGRFDLDEEGDDHDDDHDDDVEVEECYRACEDAACSANDGCDAGACRGGAMVDERSPPPRGPRIKSLVEFEFCPSSPDVCDECLDACVGDDLYDGGGNNSSNGDEGEIFMEEMDCEWCVQEVCPNGGFRPCLRRIAPLSDYLSAFADHLAVERRDMCAQCEEECRHEEQERRQQPQQQQANEEDAGYGCEEGEEAPLWCREECNEDEDFPHDATDEVVEEWMEKCEPCFCKEMPAETEQSDPDPGLTDCQVCSEECARIESMYDDGYVEATDFARCQLIYDPSEDDSENGNVMPEVPGPGSLYAGPMCLYGYNNVEIGVFSDDLCTRLMTRLDVNDFLFDRVGSQMKLHGASLRRMYQYGGPMSCWGGETEDDGEPRPTSTCTALRDDSAPKPEYVMSLANGGEHGGGGHGHGGSVLPPFVRANLEVEAIRPDGTFIPRDGEEGLGLLLRSVWAEVDEPETRTRNLEQEGHRQRKRRGQQEINMEEAYEAEEDKEREGDEMKDVEENNNGAGWDHHDGENADHAEAEWFEDWEEEDSNSDAEVRFAFLPIRPREESREWWLHSSFLFERDIEGADTEDNGERTASPWIGNAGTGVYAATEIGYYSEDNDEDVLLHCEAVEFTYADPPAGDEAGAEAEEAGNNDGGPAPIADAVVRLRDVIMGPHDMYGAPSTCGRRVVNPCEGEGDNGGGAEEELMCSMTDGTVSCVPPQGGGRGTLSSPVPGLTRREYLESYVCQRDGEDYGGVPSPAYEDENGHEGDDHDHEEEDYDEDEGEEWKEEDERPEMSYWDEYAIRPIKCAIDIKGNEMILYSFNRNNYYGTPCKQWNGTYVAPVTDFIKAFLGDGDGATAMSEDVVGCTKVDGNDEDAWVRVGCSDLSGRGLFINAYSDDECTRGRTTLEAAKFQIPFQACIRCGSRWPWQYSYWDEAEEDHEAHDEENNSNNNYNSNSEERAPPHSSQNPNNVRCSALHSEGGRGCDWQCQNALLGGARGGATRDLYWKGQRAFLQASDVSATANKTEILFQDDLGRTEYINTGGEGEELSREDFWQEGGQERRVKFYFLPNMDERPYPSADRANAHGWHLNEARMYSFNGMYTDWVYWQSEGGDSDVRVPAGKQLFFCDYVEFNYFSTTSHNGGAENGGKFVGYNVYLGAYLPGYPQYDVCSLNVYNPCQNEDGTRFTCRAIDGKVSCADDPKDEASSTPSAVSAGSSSPNELHCAKPRRVPAPDPATLEWKGDFSYLYAHSAFASYGDGTRLEFDDLLGRTVEIGSGNTGEVLARETSWADTSNGMERRLKFSFIPSSPYALTNGAEEDVATWGWRLNETLLYENKFYRPRWLSSPNNMIGVPAGKLAFHCEYVKFNFTKKFVGWSQDESDDDIWDPSRPIHQAASFVAYDFVIGAYLPKDYDICSLEVYNPCHKSGGAGKVCHAVDGKVSCLDNLEQNPQVMSMRASPAQGLPMCDKNEVITGENAPSIPDTNISEIPTPSPSSTASPTPDHDPQEVKESSSAGCRKRGLFFGVSTGITALILTLMIPS